MNGPTFKPHEGKREEFRKYLEKNGVMDALTKVLVHLYEEADKPEDALGYIRDKLAVQAGIETYEEMKARQDELQQKVDALEDEINQLKMAGGEVEINEDDGMPPPGEGELDAVEAEQPPVEEEPPAAPPAED